MCWYLAILPMFQGNRSKFEILNDKLQCTVNSNDKHSAHARCKMNIINKVLLHCSTLNKIYHLQYHILYHIFEKTHNTEFRHLSDL